MGFGVFLNTQSYLSLGGENADFKSWGVEDQERVYRFKALGYKVYNNIEKINLFRFKTIENKVSVVKTFSCKCVFSCKCKHRHHPKYKLISISGLRLGDNDFGEVYHLEHYRGINSGTDNPHFISNEQLWKKILFYNYEQLEEYYFKKSNFDRNLFLTYLKKINIPFNKNYSELELYRYWKSIYKKYKMPFPRKIVELE